METSNTIDLRDTDIPAIARSLYRGYTELLMLAENGGFKGEDFDRVVRNLRWMRDNEVNLHIDITGKQPDDPMYDHELRGAE
jgi:hypothetical protein